MNDKDKQQILQNLATQMQVAQDTIKQVEEELKKLGVDASDLPKPMLPVGDRPLLELTIEKLKAAGILEGEKRGAQVFYRLRVPCVLNFFKCVQAVQNDGKGCK